MSKILRYIFLSPVFIYIIGLAVILQLRLLVGDSQPWLALINQFVPFLFVPLIITLIVALIFRAWLLAGVNVILIVVGLVWFGPMFLPKNISSSDSTPLTVITMNVFPRNEDIAGTVNWLQAQSPDVIFLQDIGRDGRLAAFDQLDGDYPFQLRDTSSDGQIIFSRSPISDSSTLDLDEDGRTDVQRAVIEWDGTTISLYNVHLDNPLNDDSVGLPPLTELVSNFNDDRRNQQIDALMLALVTEPNPHIVAGDFNLSNFSVKYGDIARVLSDAHRQAGEGFGFTWMAPMASRQSLPQLLRLDYVWHSGDLIATDISTGPALGSDHLPVIATIARR